MTEVTQADRDAAAAYRWGWDWADLGMELHAWLLPHLGTTQSDAARQGWQDYHDQERQP